MKKLGFGCMRLPLLEKGNDESVDKVYAAELFDNFLERGFTYFDTAYMYHKSISEKVVGEVLVSRHNREEFVLASKMPVGMLEKAEDTDSIFAHQKQKCCTEYFDYYLLHCLNTENYEKAVKFGVFQALAEKKANGEIKKLGFSFHDTAGVLDKILTEHPEMEFVQLQINYLDWENESVQSRLCYETARKHGKDIIVMEPVKGGELANVPENVREMLKKTNPGVSPAQFALGFCVSLPGVVLVLSGMSDRHQLKENMDYFDSFDGFTDNDYKTAFKAAEMIKNDKLIPCTSCQYCVEGCPSRIDIPKYFAVHNNYVRGNRSQSYNEVAKNSGVPKDCIACGKCERSCPQKIDIINRLRKIKEKMD